MQSMHACNRSVPLKQPMPELVASVALAGGAANIILMFGNGTLSCTSHVQHEQGPGRNGLSWKRSGVHCALEAFGACMVTVLGLLNSSLPVVMAHAVRVVSSSQSTSTLVSLLSLQCHTGCAAALDGIRDAGWCLCHQAVRMTSHESELFKILLAAQAGCSCTQLL